MEQRDCAPHASTSTEAFVPIPSGVNETIHALQFANPKQFENYSMNWLVRRVMDAALWHFQSVGRELRSPCSFRQTDGVSQRQKKETV